jgi:5-methylcytosine-specific restriction endonuclease McrA
MANVEGWHTPADLLEMFEQQSGRCVYCEIELGTKYHVDHIRPISRGGSNWIRNIQLLCARCNRSKWALDHDEYLRRLSNQET